MKKHLWIVLLLVVALAVPVMASQAVKIFIDGQELKTEVPAQIKNGRTLVPLRAIAEGLGKQVDYDNATKTVKITGLDQLGIVEAITAEWKNAGHAQPGRPLNYAGTRDSCTHCHAGNGFLQYGTDNPYTPQADVAAGETREEAMPIGCDTCHSGAGKEMLDTGVTDRSVFIKGDYEFGSETALCISCHNGRRDTAELYQLWADGKGKTDYPHHGLGALFSGEAGMEYPGVTYARSYAHESVGCTGCHMPKTEDGYVSHDFAMNPEYIDQTCGSCHVGAKDYTVGGNLKAELEGMLAELHDAAVEAVPGATAIGMSRLQFPFVDAEGKRLDIANVSLEAYVAAYNYYMIKDDLDNFSQGVHNPQYAKSLIRESLKKLQ
ncbi:MAG: ammonia-forming cytochrome c nitrite reductase subunit c552 [Bacillota bacterium]|nr:ammonia-forming cytochrome c nitrite reductase subunit c552 [Bacillota bacterium]